jgi:hypothetical protein
MTKRKGEVTKAAIDREYPFQVERRLPERGFGKQLAIMDDWCRGKPHSKRSARRSSEFFSRWCFRDRAHADELQARFGGARIDIPRNPSTYPNTVPHARRAPRRH